MSLETWKSDLLDHFAGFRNYNFLLVLHIASKKEASFNADFLLFDCPLPFYISAHDLRKTHESFYVLSLDACLRLDMVLVSA